MKSRRSERYTAAVRARRHDGELRQHRKHEHGQQRLVMSGDLKRL